MEIWNILKLLKWSKTLETSWPYLGNYRSKTLEASWTYCTDESGLVDYFLWHWENWDLPCRGKEHTRCIIDYVQMGFQTCHNCVQLYDTLCSCMTHSKHDGVKIQRVTMCHTTCHPSPSWIGKEIDPNDQGDPRRITRNGANPTSVIFAGALKDEHWANLRYWAKTTSFL